MAGLLAPPAAAAVTKDSCPGGRTPHNHVFGNQVGEDYNDLYEMLIGASPTSRVSVASSWTCSNFQRAAFGLAFTSTLRADQDLGGSTNTAAGCSQLIVTDLNTGGRDVRDGILDNDPPDQVVCIYEQPTNLAFMVPGHDFLFEIGGSLTYDWEAPSHDTTYRFVARIDIHAEVPQPGGNPHNHPVCYKAVPQVPCNSVPV